MELKEGVIVIICQLTLFTTTLSAVWTRKDQEDYLRRYAYMGSSSVDPRLGELTNPEDKFRRAVMKFQMMAGLNATGVMTSETQKVMALPRCGVSDEVGMSSIAKKRKRRYVAQGSRWPRTSITYRINNFTPDLPRDRVTSEIKAAFKTWSDVAPLRFTEITSKSMQVDIDIGFFRGDHNDQSSFDGPGKTLAHAFFPVYGGDTHFDEDETWTSMSYQGTNLLQVAIHEFGHALGLSHSNDQGAIMAPFYRGYVPNVKLHSDDINGITNIYGPGGIGGGRAGLESPTSTTLRPTYRAPTHRVPYYPTAGPRTTRKPSPSDLCRDPTVDAFFATGAELHLFRGSLYYHLDLIGMKDGYPKPIRQEWPGLPDNIDTAFYSSGYVFFFKGDQVWSYEYRFKQLQRFYPQRISSRFIGLPNDLDAAFIWSGNGKLYFIKGDKIYRIPYFYPLSSNSRVDALSPSSLSYWKGLPAKIDAAFNFINGRTYFFSGKNFYRFHDYQFKVDAGFPQQTNLFWLNCPSDRSVESHPGMMETEIAKGRDQFDSSSGIHVAPLRHSITIISVLLTVLIAITACEF